MLRALIVGSIRAYQVVISPWLPAACRYTPGCSEYARVAVERFGPWRGGGLALRRLLRCHPFGGCGYDPVPEIEREPDRSRSLQATEIGRDPRPAGESG